MGAQETNKVRLMLTSPSRLLSCLVPVEGCLLRFFVPLKSTDFSTAFPGLCEEELWDHLQDLKEEKKLTDLPDQSGGLSESTAPQKEITEQPGELLVCWGCTESDTAVNHERSWLASEWWFHADTKA